MGGEGALVFVSLFGIKITRHHLPKKSKNAQYHRRVLRTKPTFVANFGIKITIDYRPKKSKKCSIL